VISPGFFDTLGVALKAGRDFNDRDLYDAPFRCRKASCPRKIFCERLPQIARVYGRQTERASEIIRLIGYPAAIKSADSV